MSNMEKNNTHYFGQAAEHFVVGQLLMREIPVSLPIVDDGVDLIAGNGIRIQVKAVRKRRKSGEGYNFMLAARVRKGDGSGYRVKERDMSKDVDFLILWGAEENRFWILPARIFEGKRPQGILVGSKTHRKQVDHEKIRELLASGLGLTAVAKKMDVSINCVYECSKGRTAGTYKDTIINAVESDKYENAWHEIENAVKLSRSIDEIDPVELLGEAEREHTERNLAGQSFTNEESD